MKCRIYIPLISSVLIALALLLHACGGKEQVKEQPVAKAVGTYTLKAQSLNITTNLPGRAVAYRLAEVRPQVEGIVEKRLFVEGATVTEGQQLYQIDDDKYQATYQRALAGLNNASQQRQRYAELVKKGSVSKQQFDDAEANWKLAQAELELARIDLAYTRVLAPVTGRIGRSAVSEGALVSEGQAQLLATIQQIDPMYIDITQPVSELLRLQDAMATGKIQKNADDGAEVVLLLENGRPYEHAGSLNFSEVSVDQSTGSVTLRAVVPNPDGRLLPGMFVHARLAQGRQDDAILVPQQAVLRDATGEPAVWVVAADNHIEQRGIKTVRTVGNMWLVSEGVASGERVIAEGLLRLRPGMLVDPVPATSVNPVLDFALLADQH